MLVVALVAAGCQSSDVQALPPEDDDAVESTTTTSSSTPTTETTVTTSTETTLTELARAEAAIEEAIVGWWTYPTDSSLGDEGLPLDYITGALFQRLRALNEQRTNAGEIQRSQGNPRVRIVGMQVDLDDGSAEVEVCTEGDDELVDAATGEVLAVDLAQAFSGSATVQRVGTEWKVADFFTSQAGDNPVECEIE